MNLPVFAYHRFLLKSRQCHFLHVARVQESIGGPVLLLFCFSSSVVSGWLIREFEILRVCSTVLASVRMTIWLFV